MIDYSTSWRCAICNTIVYGKIERDAIVPISLYWNVTKQEVYCGAQCSLQGHTTITEKDNG